MGAATRASSEYDAMLTSARAGGKYHGSVESPTPAAAIGRQQIGERLDLLASELRQIALDLSAASLLTQEDIAAMQRLDIVAQRLADLTNLVRADAA